MFSAKMTAVSPQVFPSDAVLDMEGQRREVPGCLFIKVNEQKRQGVAGDDDVESSRKMTIEEGLHPLLVSMKLFGLYFSRRPSPGTDEVRERKSRRRTAQLVYVVAIVVLQWFNAVRMFTIFTRGDSFGFMLLHKMVSVIWAIQCAVAQSAFCAASYSGRLEVIFRQHLDDACAKHAHKFATFYAVVSWA